MNFFLYVWKKITQIAMNLEKALLWRKYVLRARRGTLSQHSGFSQTDLIYFFTKSFCR